MQSAMPMMHPMCGRTHATGAIAEPIPIRVRTRTPCRWPQQLMNGMSLPMLVNPLGAEGMPFVQATAAAMPVLMWRSPEYE